MKWHKNECLKYAKLLENEGFEITINDFQNILIVQIPEGKEKPYQCADGFFIRMGANSQKMNRNQIIEFLQAEGQIRFEDQLHPNLTLISTMIPQN